MVGLYRRRTTMTHNDTAPKLEMVLAGGGDADLQPFLARDALLGLDQLLAGQAPGETIGADRVGAIVRLIAQGMGGACLP
jgi:hypothetical protein